MQKKFKRTTALLATAAMTIGMLQTAFAATYVVKEGDNLSKIAPIYGTTWRVLAEMNKLANPNLIFPKQVLQVPDKTAIAEQAETIKVEEKPELIEAVEVEEKLEPVEIVEKETAVLTSLDVTTMDGKTITPNFTPDTTKYDLTVQSDIYGVLINPTANEGSEITVTAAITPGAFGEEDVNEPVVIERGDGGYVVPLTQTYEGYDSVYVQTAKIEVVNGEAKNSYTITITREDDTDIYALFTQDSFKAADGTEIDYNLYVPSDYDASKSYPVVLALHGSGQKTQSVDMILKRYQMATIWAKDSEAGKNQCIVIAPQAKDNWSITAEGENKTSYPTGELSPENQAAYELLHSVMKKYNTDANRIYVTGLSMGGMGTWALTYNHPDEFAAIVPVCARLSDSIDYSRFAPMSGKIYIIHAEDDPTVKFEDGKAIMEGLDAAGIEYNSEIYASGTFFYPSAHFSWTPGYANESIRDWMFAQTK